MPFYGKIIALCATITAVCVALLLLLHYVQLKNVIRCFRRISGGYNCTKCNYIARSSKEG